MNKTLPSKEDAGAVLGGSLCSQNFSDLTQRESAACLMAGKVRKSRPSSPDRVNAGRTSGVQKQGNQCEVTVGKTTLPRCHGLLRDRGGNLQVVARYGSPSRGSLFSANRLICETRQK
jgi:hypothetical protein